MKNEEYIGEENNNPVNNGIEEKAKKKNSKYIWILGIILVIFIVGIVLVCSIILDNKNRIANQILNVVQDVFKIDSTTEELIEDASKIQSTAEGLINDITNSQSNEEITDDASEIQSKAEELIKNISETMSTADIKTYNTIFEFYTGSQYNLVINALLDQVVTNNKTNTDNIITVTYGETTTTQSDEIVNIKHSLEDFKKYEVSLDYNENGLVSKVVVKNI